MAKLSDGVGQMVEESMPHCYERFSDLRALKKHGCLTLAQCALLITALDTASVEGDASEMAAHWMQLALLDVAEGELSCKHPVTLLPYSQYRRMQQSGMFGEDAAALPVPDAGWLVSLDETERWLLAKEHKVDFDGVRSDLEIMRRDGLDEWPTQAQRDLSEPAPAVAPAGGNVARGDWVAHAVDFAKKYIDRHKEQGLFPSQANVCDHVECKLRENSIFGSHGKPLSASYILRNAIQGDWWKQNKS